MRADSIASSIKRQRFTTVNPMELESAKVKLAAAKEKFGREIRVFETAPASSTASDISSNVSEEPEDFYEFTPEDYYRLLGTKKEEKHLKTKKIREEEEAARKARITARITKAVIRVRFPDNYTLEATFHPSETIQSLLDLLMKVITHPELPFYIYTTPPKKQIKDASQDFYSAGFIPGAIVYFSYNLPKGTVTVYSEKLRFVNGPKFPTLGSVLESLCQGYSWMIQGEFLPMFCVSYLTDDW
ncbi:plant UBX domain-containing protein 1 isoform X3 [Lycium barbarum]|uniref:plant UBX domain-containing protein 1 isoform X3 n=1 Tax=Lycium barbarum TaxID=112863 RepID=UPI00293E65C2|nr:plant UBX domain-containing protein 1 isoform X3 [Lycium barbarum]